MTAAFDDLISRLDTLPLAVRQATVGIVERLGERLLDLNRAYLLAGERPDGAPIDADGYSPAYAAYRRKFGRQTAVKDLFLTGDYSKRFVLEYAGSLRFEVGNLDPKAAKLLASYGALYGVRDEDVVDFVVHELKPQLEEIIQQHMAAA